MLLCKPQQSLRNNATQRRNYVLVQRCVPGPLTYLWLWFSGGDSVTRSVTLEQVHTTSSDVSRVLIT